MQRSDRALDFKTLALWFSECEDDREAHRLWRAAFGLSPARHLRIDAESLDRRASDPIPPSTSWIKAPPLEISPRLRKHGRYTRGRPTPVVDRSREKALLAKALEREAAQLADARRRLATHQRTRLSELDRLDRTSFDVFLDLLGQALAAKVESEETGHATSSDGSLSITLEPTLDGRVAAIETSDGTIHGADHFVTISETFGGPAR